MDSAAINLNPRNLTGKTHELRAQIDIWDWDIAASPETWLRGKQYRELNVLGFTFGGKRRGELCFRLGRISRYIGNIYVLMIKVY